MATLLISANEVIANYRVRANWWILLLELGLTSGRLGRSLNIMNVFMRVNCYCKLWVSIKAKYIRAVWSYTHTCLSKQGEASFHTNRESHSLVATSKISLIMEAQWQTTTVCGLIDAKFNPFNINRFTLQALVAVFQSAVCGAPHVCKASAPSFLWLWQQTDCLMFFSMTLHFRFFYIHKRNIWWLPWHQVELDLAKRSGFHFSTINGDDECPFLSREHLFPLTSWNLRFYWAAAEFQILPKSLCLMRSSAKHLEIGSISWRLIAQSMSISPAILPGISD